MAVLVEAATCISVSAESIIDRLGACPCAAEGTAEWADGLTLARAARRLAKAFAELPNPALEERSIALAGRIVTRLLGQCYAFVGRGMIETAEVIRRNGDSARAAGFADPVIHDFQPLLGQYTEAVPLDEDRIGIEYLLAGIDLRGGSTRRNGRARRASPEGEKHAPANGGDVTWPPFAAHLAPSQRL